MPLPRPRVSLLTLMLLMTIVTMGAALWKLNSELVPLRVEVRELREEVGRLTIVDQTKVHAIAFPGYQPLTWTYRVFLPPERNYVAACKINDLPLSGTLPQCSSPPSFSGKPSGKSNCQSLGLTPGEHLITLVFSKDTQGDWRFSLYRRGSIFDPGGKLEDEHGGYSFALDAQWLPSWEGIGGGVSEEMSVVAPDRPLVLLDIRPIRGAVRGGDKSTEGVIVWIEPVP